LALIRRSAASLAAIASSGSVAEFMFEQMIYGPDPLPSPGEARSWDRSIPVLAADLVQAGLGDVEVLEHRLPLSSRRVDAILAGRHPVSGTVSYVVVELTQWSVAELYEDDPGSIRSSRSAGTASTSSTSCQPWPATASDRRTRPG
jgi:uncharacterized protein